MSDPVLYMLCVLFGDFLEQSLRCLRLPLAGLFLLLGCKLIHLLLLILLKALLPLAEGADLFRELLGE